MTAYKFTSHKHLRDILNNVEKVQQTDINSFSWGHLNEKNLYKQPYSATHGRIWKGSKKKKPVIKDSDLFLIPNPKQKAKSSPKDTKMGDVLFEFSVGTTGSVPAPSPSKAETPPRREKISEFKQDVTVSTAAAERGRSSSASSEKSIYSQLDDGILVEELDNHEMVLKSPRMGPTVYQPKKFKPADDDFDMIRDLTQALDSDGYLTMKHTFLPTFTAGVTKKDQFDRLVKFEDSVLRKQDCREKKVLSGEKAVRHLERRLEEVGQSGQQIRSKIDSFQNANFLISQPNPMMLPLIAIVLETLSVTLINRSISGTNIILTIYFNPFNTSAAI